MKTKLAQLLSKLEKQEITAFEKYLQSPYFNNSPVVLRYWKQLKKYAPSFDIPKPSAEKLFKKLYPEEDFEEKKLRQLRSRFLKLVEDFLAIEQLRRDDFAYKKRIADAYFEKEIKKEFEKRYHLLLKTMEVEDFLTEKELSQKLSLYHQLYFNHLHAKRDTYPKYLEASTRLLKYYHERRKQLYALEWVSLKEQFSHPIPTTISQYTEDLNARTPELVDTLESLYINMLKLFIAPKEKEETVYFICKEQLIRNYECVSLKEKNIFLKLLINFCISRFKEGEQLNQELFSLYSLGLSDKAIFVEDKMTNITFLTIVTTGVKLQKFDWAKSFIIKEKWRLFEKDMDLYIKVADASILFYTNKFKDCVERLSTIEHTHFTTMDVVRKNLQIRAIFECYIQDNTYQKLLMTNINNFEKYLTRKLELSIQKRTTNLTFLFFLKKIILWKEVQNNDEESHLIKEQLDQTKSISKMYKKWLIYHIENITKEKGLLKTTPVQI